MADELTAGNIFDIQGFSVHDGPGCRTLVFFKGCTMQCPWCANPEGINPLPEPLYRADLCTLDGYCVAACPHQAITVQHEKITLERAVCRSCKEQLCVSACLTGALKMAGYSITLDDLFAKITRDRQYWGPDGGVTLTGGEPFAQPKFAEQLLRRCYEAYIHTAAETCGNVPWSSIARSLPFLDWIFFDLKIMIPERAEQHQIHGKALEQIKRNARILTREFEGKTVFRLPVIPGINDDPENIRATAEFIQETGCHNVNILPGHHLGREKYAMLGRRYYTGKFTSPSTQTMDRIKELFSGYGVTCHIGSETPY
jgi:glycyl-radical enzyme activating protein